MCCFDRSNEQPSRKETEVKAMEPLANNWGDRADEYDVVVIGSGYGGAITAARMAAANGPLKPSVCILERGREWIPGTFPDAAADALQHYLSPLNPLGLYEYRQNKDIDIIQGSGLGGTSLVNANVAIIPEDGIFARSPWPAAIRMEQLRPFYRRAADTLEIAEHPQGRDLPKVKALSKGIANDPQARFELLKLAVNFRPDFLDERGVERRKCIDCGDCVTGCNVRAKNTLYMNYLPLAKSLGASIFTQVKVRYVEAAPDGGYRIHFERYHPRHPLAERGILRARRAVVVAAGALGSTEILLRSREKGLALPDTVGTRFSGNGDFFGIAYNSREQTDVMGFGNHLDDPVRSQVKAGPTIVGAIRYKGGQDLSKQFTVEDLTVPRAAVEAARAALAFMPGVDFDLSDNLEQLQRVSRDARATLEGTVNPKGAMNHSLAYLVMGQDDSGGRMDLHQDRLRLDWTGAGDDPIFGRINAGLKEHAKALGARFIQNPVWDFLRLRQLVPGTSHLVTAHPLGGCPMGETHESGLVNDRGQVFKRGGGLLPGLYVADGSIVPTALNVNPFLTISALCERIAEHLVAELAAG